MTSFAFPLACALLLLGSGAYQYFVGKEIGLRQLGLYVAGTVLVLVGNYDVYFHHDNGWIMVVGFIILFTAFWGKIKRR